MNYPYLFKKSARNKLKDSVAWKRQDSCMVRQNFPGRRELSAGQTEKTNFHQGNSRDSMYGQGGSVIVRIKGSGRIKLLISNYCDKKYSVLGREIKLFACLRHLFLSPDRFTHYYCDVNSHFS